MKRKNVLEKKNLLVKVRFTNEKRYHLCRVYRIYHIDKVVSPENKQRYIYASIELVEPTSKDAEPPLCFINVPLTWFHYKAQGTLVQAAFAQEEIDMHEVGHHAEYSTS